MPDEVLKEEPEESVAENPFGKPEFPCSVCTLYREPGPVPGRGNRNAKILYVGEAPGAEEVDTPRFRKERFAPFVGGAGRIRSAMLEHAGLHKDVHLFTTNVVKCRPPNNRLPTPHEIRCCAKFLLEEIEDVQPNVIIAAGELALTTLTDKSKIGLWRGVPTAGPIRKKGENGEADQVYKVFPTWHPVYIARAQHYWPFAVHDLARAKTESTFPEIRRIPFTVTRQASLAATADDLRRSVRERGAVTFDFETTGLSADRDQIRMCGFVGRPDTAYVYDWTLGTQQLFEEFFAEDGPEIIGQNILYFDIPFAEEKGHKVRWTRIFDTMVAFHLTNSSYGQTSIASQNEGSYQGARGAEKDLSFIASNHTDIEYWKSKDAYKGDLYGVCGVDVVATDRAANDPVNGIKAELKAYDMLDLYYKHVLPVHLPLRNMTKRGVRCDEERAAGWAYALTVQADKMEADLREGLSEPFLNIESPKQLMELLYGKLKLPIQYVEDKKRGRRPTANKAAVEKLAEMFPENAIVGLIATIRHLRKMNATFVRPGMESGRFHPRFGVSKAANGRFNSQDPNGQNVPEMMREIWVPDDPKEDVLISSDSSQIEWRLAMVLSGDPVGLELLASGVDNHRAVASEALGKEYEAVSDEERQASKFIVYGLGYGRGAYSIAKGHKLPEPFVKRFITNFFGRFGVFKGWREGLLSHVKDNHYLVNPFKRRRWWYTWDVTEMYNFPASSTAADMMYETVMTLENQLPKGATLRMTVHDEVVVNCKRDVVKEAVTCIRDVMQRKWPEIVETSARPENVKRFYPGGWFCPADVHLGTDWAMTKSKNSEKKAARAKLEKELLG